MKLKHLSIRMKKILFPQDLLASSQPNGLSVL